MGATQSHERPSSAEPGPNLFAAALGAGESMALIADRYRLIARIHEGTGGVLYRAEDIAFARSVALRLLTPSLSRDEAVLERLRSRLEASVAMAREDVEASGDIIDLTDLGRAINGQVFVVTELLTGENLATSIARDGPMTWPALRPLMVRACQILHLSHQHGLLRLDLQTRHLFPVRDKTQTSTLKILSPGIGDVFGDSLWSKLDPASAARQLRYAAPEQLTGGLVDARTDIYALGIIMYELLCGHVPFSDGRPAYVCARHLLEQPPPFPAELLVTIPREVVGIVGRALAKAPAERWPTMRAFANAMAAIGFGPCDASGTLEVGTVPPTPAGVSQSMRIDPAAGHAPSPVVLPRTLPPLRDAFRAANAATSERVVAADSRAIDERAQTYERWFKGSPELDPTASGSSSQMAWEEILAAAEEAVAAVASASGSGTAGDSGVFIPERLLHSGEAATASTVRGRRPVLTGPPIRAAARGAPPTVRVAAPRTTRTAPPVELAEAAAASTTLQLGPEDLHGIDSPAGDSAADLPRDARPTSGPLPGDSAAALRELAAHSAPVWVVNSAEVAPSQRSHALAWAAAVILTLGAAAGGLQWLRPGASAAPELAVAAPIASASEVAPMRAQPRFVRQAPATPLAVGSMAAPSQWTESAGAAAPGEDLVIETGSTSPPPTAPAELSPGTARSPSAPDPIVAVAPAAGELPVPRPTKRRSAAPASASPGQPEDPGVASSATAQEVGGGGNAAGRPEDPGVASSGASGPDEPPAPGPRKTLPGTRPPDAGHDAASGDAKEVGAGDGQAGDANGAGNADGASESAAAPS